MGRLGTAPLAPLVKLIENAPTVISTVGAFFATPYL